MEEERYKDLRKRAEEMVKGEYSVGVSTSELWELILEMDRLREEIKKLKGKIDDFIDEYDNEILEKNNYIFQLENKTLKEEDFDQVYMKAIADYKDKIRNKIKEVENGLDIEYVNIVKRVLEELLGDKENE